VFPSVVVYLLLKDEARAILQNLDTAPPAYRLLRDFIAKDEERVRFKVRRKMGEKCAICLKVGNGKDSICLFLLLFIVCCCIV
jgi:hypothetical protein